MVITVTIKYNLYWK